MNDKIALSEVTREIKNRMRDIESDPFAEISIRIIKNQGSFFAIESEIKRRQHLTKADKSSK